MVSLSIKRVVSVFILRPNKSPPAIIQPQRHLKNNNNVAYQIALFRRCDTMPTFPNHWAGISGSIEEDDGSPFDAAVRELREETNIGELLRNYYGGSCSGSSSGNVGEEEEEDKLLRKCMKQGLHVDVSSNRSKGAFGAGRIIRVYPFALSLPAEVVDDDKLLPKETEGDNSKSSTVGGGGGDSTKTGMDTCSSQWSNIEMKGTEHDRMKFTTIDEFLDMNEPFVPALKLAFHHATFGSYLKLPEAIRTWEQDRVHGAAFLARQAVNLAASEAHTTSTTTTDDDTIKEQNYINNDDNKISTALSIAMLRPSMVPIVNVMYEFDRRVIQYGEDPSKARDDILQSLDDEGERCVELGVETVLIYYEKRHQPQTLEVNPLPYSDTAECFVVGTFRRSSTLKSILGRVLQTTSSVTHTTKIKVVCSQSTPGDEGILLASDIPDATYLPDKSFQQRIKEGKIDLVLVGADCVLLPEGEKKGVVVNKVGTAALAECCKRSDVPIVCCADRWKLWEDDDPPGLEDIFELVGCEMLDHVLVPS